MRSFFFFLNCTQHWLSIFPKRKHAVSKSADVFLQVMLKGAGENRRAAVNNITGMFVSHMPHSARLL